MGPLVNVLFRKSGVGFLLATNLLLDGSSTGLNRRGRRGGSCCCRRVLLACILGCGFRSTHSHALTRRQAATVAPLKAHSKPCGATALYSATALAVATGCDTHTVKTNRCCEAGFKIQILFPLLLNIHGKKQGKTAGQTAVLHCHQLELYCCLGFRAIK